MAIVLTPNNIGNGLELFGDKIQVKAGSNITVGPTGVSASAGAEGGDQKRIFLPNNWSTASTTGAAIAAGSSTLQLEGTATQNEPWELDCNIVWSTTSATAVLRLSVVVALNEIAYGIYSYRCPSSASAVVEQQREVTSLGATSLTSNTGSGLTANKIYLSRVRGIVQPSFFNARVSLIFYAAASTAGTVSIYAGSSFQIRSMKNV